MLNFTKFIVSYPVLTGSDAKDYVLGFQIHVSHMTHIYPFGKSAKRHTCQGLSAFEMHQYVTAHKNRL